MDSSLHQCYFFAMSLFFYQIVLLVFIKTAHSDSSYILHTKLVFQIGLFFLLKHKITLFYLLSFVFIRFITRCYSLPLIVIFCYWLSFVAIRCLLLYHPLSLVESLVAIRCITWCHSLSLAVIRCHSMYYSFYKRSLFHNVLLFKSFIIKTKTKNTQFKVWRL